jgi:hypothetical protein
VQEYLHGALAHSLGSACPILALGFGACQALPCRLASNPRAGYWYVQLLPGPYDDNDGANVFNMFIYGQKEQSNRENVYYAVYMHVCRLLSSRGHGTKKELSWSFFICMNHEGATKKSVRFFLHTACQNEEVTTRYH